MASGELIETEGIVRECLPKDHFLVELRTEGFEGHTVRAHLSGKMRMHYIRIVQGDKVKVEFSPYNLNEGRITFRFK